MATGRVLQFDQARGFGFITAEDGGDDVFLHASVFDGEMAELVPGKKVEFEIMAGDRGRKAFAVQIADNATATTPAQAESAPQPAPSPYSAEEEQLCDVLSQSEFTAELTEVLLESVPTLTAQQIVQARESLLEFAKKRGWVDA